MSDIELSVKLDAWIDDNTVDGDFIAHPDFVYDKLLELETKIKKLQAENAELKKQNQWVSVKDRLPKADGCYLVYQGEFRFSRFYIKGSWINSKEDKYGSITHWMPLPTPPKGE